MQRLIEGHKRFLQEVFPERRSHFHLLSEGQAPEWLFITCSDSRVVPDLVLGTEPGDLFITRNANQLNSRDQQRRGWLYRDHRIRCERAEGARRHYLRSTADCGALKQPGQDGPRWPAEGRALATRCGSRIRAPPACESRRR